MLQPWCETLRVFMYVLEKFLPFEVCLSYLYLLSWLQGSKSLSQIILCLCEKFITLSLIIWLPTYQCFNRWNLWEAKLTFCLQYSEWECNSGLLTYHASYIHINDSTNAIIFGSIIYINCGCILLPQQTLSMVWKPLPGIQPFSHDQ